jgi:hypothetical protein
LARRAAAQLWPESKNRESFVHTTQQPARELNLAQWVGERLRSTASRNGKRTQQATLPGP